MVVKVIECKNCGYTQTKEFFEGNRYQIECRMCGYTIRGKI